MKEQEAVAAVVQECIGTWAATVRNAAEANYGFCMVGYFEIPDAEHSSFHPLLLPLLEDIESKGAQALVFRPHMAGVYDHSGSTIVAYLQNQWHYPARRAQDVPTAREVHLLSKEYIHSRDVTVDEDPLQRIRGRALPQTQVPTFRSNQPGEHITGAVGVCWRQPRLK